MGMSLNNIVDYIEDFLKAAESQKAALFIL